MHGGKRPGSGRPAGKPNKRSERFKEELARVAAVVEQALPEPFHGDAHALLMMVYKDPSNEISLRIDAAGKAIGYEKPKLTDNMNTNATVSYVVNGEPAVSTDEWSNEYAPPVAH
jgi:hypothetical protein